MRQGGVLCRNFVVFRENVADFWWRWNITVFLSKFAWSVPRKKFWSLSGCREPKSLKTTGFDNPLNTIKTAFGNLLKIFPTQRRNKSRKNVSYLLINFSYFCFADYLIFLLIFSCFFLLFFGTNFKLFFARYFSCLFLIFPEISRNSQAIVLTSVIRERKKIPIRWNDLELSSCFFLCFSRIAGLGV